MFRIMLLEWMCWPLVADKFLSPSALRPEEAYFWQIALCFVVILLIVDGECNHVYILFRQG